MEFSFFITTKFNDKVYSLRNDQTRPNLTLFIISPITTLMMKYIFIFIIACTNVQVLAAEENLNDINQLNWNNRILLIKPKLACDQEAPLLMASETDINERDILWFVFCKDGVETNYLGTVSEKFIADTIESLFIYDNVSIILVGKDGGVKRRTNDLELTRLFELIDSMPMRKTEMRN